ncbi:hypothetical protein [Caminibacter pacificus]
MRLVKRYKINRDVDLIYAKRDLSNFLKREKKELVDFFVFATMELGTNLIKHANGGEIWLLEQDESFLLASLDEGPGIKDTSWCVQKGNTTYKNSLGLGLYSLSNNESYEFEIFSSEDMGSVFLLKPKIENSEVFFQIPYLNEKYSGDLIVKKNKFYLFADVSGHGKKAWQSGQFIKEFFLKRPVTLLFCDEFFKDLHESLKKNSLRSCVICIAENLPSKVNLCGVGNIGVFYKNIEGVRQYSFKSGIVGEVFTTSSSFSFEKENAKVILKTDGIDDNVIREVLKNELSNEMTAISVLFFSKRNDDKSILIIGE